MTASRLEPRPWDGSYHHRRALAILMRAQAGSRLAGRGQLRVVDVGCGKRPYEPIFAPHASQYLGVDAVAGPRVDVVAPAEALPLDDATFDVAVCSQVLEHVNDPVASVKEIRRVLRPGGVAFLSTHGVAAYHPNPQDLWRWTHAGLERVFRDAGDWHTIDVFPNGGTGSAIGYLMNGQIEAAARRRAPALSMPLVLLINAFAVAADRVERRVSSTAPSLSPSYLVVAEAPRQDAISPSA